MVSNHLTPVEGTNYGQQAIHVKSELTELHTVSEPSLPAHSLSPQQQGIIVY